MDNKTSRAVAAYMWLGMTRAEAERAVARDQKAEAARERG